jgi:hypothetical protein
VKPFQSFIQETAMKEFLELSVIAVAGMAAVASILYLAVALGQDQSPGDALMYLGLSVGALGVMGLLDTEKRIDRLTP